MTPQSPQPSGLRRLSARFEGHVQGVGFRYTTLQIAMALSVTGFVANQPDGSVALIAEGEVQALHALLDRIQSSHLGHGIMAVDVRWSDATSSFPEFRIRSTCD